MTRLVHPMIPMAERELHVSFVEHGVAWCAAAPVERVLAVLETLAVARASVDYGETWAPYNRGAAIATVLHGANGVTTVNLRASEGISATIQQTPGYRNSVGVAFPAAEVERRGLRAIEQLIAAVVDTLPQLTIAIATAAHQTDFPALFDEAPSPPPFLQTAWLHVVPAGANDAFLRAAPARIEPHDDGTLWMYTYPDPMHYDTEAAVDAMRTLSRYLRRAA